MTSSIQYGNFIPAAAEKHNCVKSAHIRSYSSPYFPAFVLNTERYFLSLRIQSECEKMRNRKTPNTDNFYAVHNTILMLFQNGHIANKEIGARYTFIQHEVYIPSGTDDKVLDRGDYILSRKRMILFIETVKELYLSNLIDLSTGVFSLIT